MSNLEYLEKSTIHLLFTQRVVCGICTSMHVCACLLYFTGMVIRIMSVDESLVLPNAQSIN